MTLGQCVLSLGHLFDGESEEVRDNPGVVRLMMDVGAERVDLLGMQGTGALYWGVAV